MLYERWNWSSKSPGVQHGREVDVHADAAQPGRGLRAGGTRGRGRIGRGADLRFGLGRSGPGQAADLAAFLVTHEQQRILAGGVGAGRIRRDELADDALQLRLTGDVEAEEDDAADVAVADQVQQPGGRGQAVVAVYDSLAGQLLRRQLRDLAGLRLERGELSCGGHRGRALHGLRRSLGGRLRRWRA
jgi:hypothetical protein